MSWWKKPRADKPTFDHVLYTRAATLARGDKNHKVINLASCYVALWENGNRYGWTFGKRIDYEAKEKELRIALAAP